MKNNEELRLLEPLELMLQWNRYCDAHGREGDCILLSEPLTYSDLNDGDEQLTLKEILNNDSPEFKKDKGYLVPVYESNYYKGLLWVSEDDIGKYIDLDLIRLD